MREYCIEDKTLIWVDSTQRDKGGTGSDYSVTMIEPLRNVVGIRVIEATIPATIMSIGAHNSQLSVHTVAYGDELPVGPEQILAAHTAGLDGEAWRAHDSTGKRTYYDVGQDSEHHIAHRTLDVYRTLDASDIAFIDPNTIADGANPIGVLCVVPGNQTAILGSTSIYDQLARMTVVFCAPSPTLQFVTSVDIVAGVYRLPHGKYDSLRDFVSELGHLYAPSKVGVMLTFVTSVSDKPERSFQLQVDPSLVWSHVDTGSPSYEHTYLPRPRHWCAVWAGSSSIRALGFHTNPVPLTTAGGDFIVSEAQPRYNGRLLGRTLVDLTSERYVWLRCPEVERHMCTGVGKVMQRGIGVFRLDVPGVLNQDRTEYISVIPNQFHPISKVSKLSFRFDMGSRENTPYDFREINHFMLLSIATLRPDSARLYETLPRALNPEYEPNVLKFHMLEHDRRNTATRSLKLSAPEMRRVVEIHNSALITNSDGR